jgi:dCTP deaminase
MTIVGASKLQKLLYYTQSADERLVVTPILDRTSQIPESSGAIDLRLGQKFIFPKRANVSYLDPREDDFRTKLHRSAEILYIPYGEWLVLHPHQFVLGNTLEYFRLPSNLSGYVVSRSSWGRMGLVVATATAVHPGYFGVLCLELTNLGEVPIYLYPGLCIAQIFFNEVTAEPSDKRALSVYLGATEVELPDIFILDDLHRLERLSK